MKKIFFLISVAFLFITGASAQTYVVIPDANFRAALKDLYPTCFNVSDEMDITCSDIVNATNLYLNNKNISSIEGVQYFTKLESISCSNNQITSLGTLPPLITSLIANDNKIETFLEFPIKLTHIEVDNNLIVNLPAWPPHLDYFSANNNKIESLSAFPTTLTRLFLGTNNLSVIPTFPEGMYDIVCYNNKLTRIPNIPSSLAALFCGKNFLTSLPVIPAQTMIDGSGNCYTDEYLNSVVLDPSKTLLPNRADCNSTPVENFVVISDVQFRTALKGLYPTSFNANDEMNVLSPDIVNAKNMDLISKGISDLTGIEYFSSLEHLNLNNNFITELSNLPTSLTYLDCSTNTLSSLSNLPEGLTYLNCEYNFYLTEIINLPSELEYLNCHFNSKLEVLPDLPLNLQTLLCNKCKLTALPSLPSSLITLDCSSNYLVGFPTLSSSNSRINSTKLTLPENLEILNASENCFEETPINPNPSILISFTVTPNRTDCGSLTTGIDVPSSAAIKIYPNPASDKINIEVYAESTIIMYSSIGEIVLQRTISAAEEIDIRFLNTGLYYYTIGKASGKLIVK